MEHVDGLAALEEDETSALQIPLCMPCPTTPTADQSATLNLKHMPYRKSCPGCVAGKQPNARHRSMVNASPRSIPVLHLDSCGLWADAEEDKPTALVIQVEPTTSIIVNSMDVKGPGDPYGCVKLTSFLKTHRVEPVVC